MSETYIFPCATCIFYIIMIMDIFFSIHLRKRTKLSKFYGSIFFDRIFTIIMILNNYKVLHTHSNINHQIHTHTQFQILFSFTTDGVCAITSAHNSQANPLYNFFYPIIWIVHFNHMTKTRSNNSISWIMCKIAIIMCFTEMICIP